MRFIFVTLISLALAIAAHGQMTTGDTVTVSVGKQLIKLPTPVGYVNAWEKYPNLRTAFEVNETDGNQMLAMSVPPLGSGSGLESGKYLGFPKYFRASVTKSIADTDFSESQFSEFADSFNKGVGAMFKSVPARRKWLRTSNAI